MHTLIVIHDNLQQYLWLLSLLMQVYIKKKFITKFCYSRNHKYQINTCNGQAMAYTQLSQPECKWAPTVFTM